MTLCILHYHGYQTGQLIFKISSTNKKTHSPMRKVRILEERFAYYNSKGQ